MEPIDLRHVGGGGDLSRSRELARSSRYPGALFRAEPFAADRKLASKHDPAAESGRTMSIIAIAEDFARDTILPRAAAWEKSRSMATAELREAINVGIGSLRIGAEHGGLGLDYLCMGKVLSVLASADFPFAFSLAVHRWFDSGIRFRPPKSIDMLAGYRPAN
jgi:Acyl-CoA dehydrogenase, N-terminal domain